AVGAGVTRDQIAERIGDRREEGSRDVWGAREGDAQGVAVAGGVLDGGEAALAPEVEGEDAMGGGEPGDEGGGQLGGGAAGGDLGLGEVAQGEEEIVQGVGVLDGAVAVEALEGSLEIVDGLGVEQLAELGLAEQLAELGRIDAEGVSAALG